MSSSSRKLSRKAAKAPGMARSKQERVDDAIMNTNDSSIVSKRSVCKLYMADEPDFYEPFVHKFIRRNPLINRGYWLRMHAIEQVVRRFLEGKSAKTKVIVNLGCGYDPLPFQFWHRHTSLSQGAVFVDVDYPQLIRRKRDRMLASDLLRNALLRTNLRPAHAPVYLRSDQYLALGCDLKDIQTLERLLQAELDASRASFLFVAEVSVTYMPTPDADALVRWASTLEDARFCLLEQVLPQGPEHPFAKTMLRHFDKLHTPIQAVKQYPRLNQQISRFVNAGWPTVEIARSLWDLWSDEGFTSPAVRCGLDAVESFDEWEEFALFAGHYFLLVASTSKDKVPLHTGSADQSARRVDETCKAHLTLAHHDQSHLELRRFGSAFTLGQDTVAFHGGQGVQTRLSSIDVLGSDLTEPCVLPCSSTPPQARMCHSVTSLDNACALLVGGRTSPSHALADCWLIEQGRWTQVGDLSPARFRHSSARLTLSSEKSVDQDNEAVLIFGGKTSDGTVLDEWALWTRKAGWNTIAPVNGPRPAARFGAAMVAMDPAEDWGVMMGGLAPCGTVLHDFWEWHISAAPHPQLTFIDRTNNLRYNGEIRPIGRLGASLVPFGDNLLLIGGVSKQGILDLSEDFLVISRDSTPNSTAFNAENAALKLPQSTWPLIVGTNVAAVSRDEVVFAGGGAVCFSMGSFWNTGYFSITLGTEEVRRWTVAVPKNHDAGTDTNPQQLSGPDGKPPVRKDVRPGLPQSTVIARIRIESADDFAALLAASKPAIMENLDIGPCKALWTLEYLKEKVGVEREVVIHECTTDRMTFKDKNFSYVKKPFGEFIDGISAGAQAYMRAVSSSQPNKLPTKIEDDFPSVAGDFRLPDVFDVIKPNLHSSPLRISGPVALWLHYDVLANVLCQVRGSKTLHLFPPSDVKYLSYPPGGSSSNIDILTSKDTRLNRTHPHIAHLNQGDILFIPPMWSHTAVPEDGVSVAVNVFFRNLENGYAAGKDVYGNRDLQPYENGRRDVERIAKAFKHIPDDMSKFYLDRLAAELQDKADSIGRSKGV